MAFNCSSFDSNYIGINTARSVSAMIAISIINIITVPLIDGLGNGDDRKGYLLIAILYGVIFALCHIFCFAKTKEVVKIPKKQKIELKNELKAVIRNKPYILAFIGQLLFGFTLYGRNANALYYFTYVEGNVKFFSTYSLAIMIPSIIGAACFPLLFKLTKNKGRIGIMKHSFTTIPGILWVITGVVLLFYKLNKTSYNKIISELNIRKTCSNN